LRPAESTKPLKQEVLDRNLNLAQHSKRCLTDTRESDSRNAVDRSSNLSNRARGASSSLRLSPGLIYGLASERDCAQFESTAMLKTLTVLLPAIAALAGYSQPVNAASKASCDGTLTDQRGISLGNCDLNSLSAADYDKIIRICGQPNGANEDTNKTACHVRGASIPKKGFPGIVVLKHVYSVEKTQPQNDCE
jgi:hypothetical protein